MALDRTPWLVSTPGVQHSSEVARTIAYAATNGATGVNGGGNTLKVVAQGTPNGTVQVLPGVAVAVSNYPGATGQSYVMRNATSTNVSIAPTTSAGGRTDALIIRVDDIGLVGTVPENVNAYDYTKLEVIQGVASGITSQADLNLNYPFVLLAKITIPASTATITNAMITDLRQIANPRTQRLLYAYELNGADEQSVHTTSTVWPTSATRTVRIPEWAQVAHVVAHWGTVRAMPGQTKGRVHVAFSRPDGATLGTQTSGWSTPAADVETRISIPLGGDIKIPSSWRGQTVTLAMYGTKTSGPNAYMDGNSTAVLDVEFRELAD